MDHAAQLIKSIAAIAWPVIVVLALALAWPILRDRLKRDPVTFKYGSMELTLESVAKQVSDLQNQQIAGSQRGSGELPPAASTPIQIARGSRILWVDDRPQYNTFEVGRLKDCGIIVEQASTTNDGLRKLVHGDYDLLITDMEREEGGHVHPRAGLELLRQVKSDPRLDLPTIVYCSPEAVHKYGDEALIAGAAAVTHSPLALLGILYPQVTDKAGVVDKVVHSSASVSGS
ncbi:hypothetical protein [Blastococcus deserti]|uniref:Response regulatory domain-containing protein n=1 Tax=Blastococcus deserti TaxID=2259033 RepID=A0ABW4XD12_9ACTN